MLASGEYDYGCLGGRLKIALHLLSACPHGLQADFVIPR
jgi:hypothetical protein